MAEVGSIVFKITLLCQEALGVVSSLHLRGRWSKDAMPTSPSKGMGNKDAEPGAEEAVWSHLSSLTPLRLWLLRKGTRLPHPTSTWPSEACRSCGGPNSFSTCLGSLGSISTLVAGGVAEAQRYLIISVWTFFPFL